MQECARSLNERFNSSDMRLGDPDAYRRLMELIPDSLCASLHLLPVSRLPKGPLFSLLRGFETDLEFDIKKNIFPIATEEDLELYAYRVAGTIAELLLHLIFYHYPIVIDDSDRLEIISSGERMGRALQYVNISRDVTQDAAIGRVYIPTSWLSEEGLTPSMVVNQPNDPRITVLRRRLLCKAESCYRESQASIDRLPLRVRGPIRATVMSYMEIAHVIRGKKGKTWSGKLRVPLWRRAKVAWLAMAVHY
jgi:15-cis-phytoene synthase/lycopene beta-cyclase